MKNLFKQKFALLAVASVFVLASCNKKDEISKLVKPSITVSATAGGSALSSKGKVKAGDTVKMTVKVTAPGNFNSMLITEANNLFTKISKSKKDFKSSKEVTYSFGIPTKGSAGKKFDIQVVAQDTINQKDTAKFTFEVEAPASPDVKKIAATKLYAVLGSGASKSFLSISEGKLYSHNDVKGAGTTPVSKNIDFGYYYGSTAKATLVAPASFPSSIFNLSSWTTKKATKMVKTTLKAEDYTKLKTVADVDAKIKSLTIDKNQVSGLAAGDIIAFKTADSTPISGFIKVTNLKDGFGSSDYVEVEVVTNQASK